MKIDSPAALVAVAYAARKIGDKDLETSAKNKLVESHGIRIVFERDSNSHSRESKKGGSHDPHS